MLFKNDPIVHILGSFRTWAEYFSGFYPTYNLSYLLMNQLTVDSNILIMHDLRYSGFNKYQKEFTLSDNLESILCYYYNFIQYLQFYG